MTVPQCACLICTEHAAYLQSQAVSPPPPPDLTEERVRELVSFEVRRLLGSPHAFGALADRVQQLENGAASTVRAQVDAALERVADQIVTALVGDKFPQYRNGEDLGGF
jgi:hypothetical protein